jgi:transcriptional regulator with XRE-family HTH domain
LRRLGERLRRERLRRNQTQTEFAQFVGVTRQTYAKLEEGSGTVRLGVLARVLGVLGHAARLVDLLPELPEPIDFDEAARLASRRRAAPKRQTR